MSRLGYRYYLGSFRDAIQIDRVKTLWRVTPEGYSEITTNNPDDWTHGNGVSLDAFQACDKLTKREAKRFFPLATIL